MPIQIHTLKTKVAHVVVPFDSDEVDVIYNAGLITPAFYDELYVSPAREMLADVLVSWDVLQDDGTPLQPDPLDAPDWAGRALDWRIAQARRERASSGNDPLTDAEISALETDAPTDDERHAAYCAAWQVILRELPQPFLLAVLDAIMDDVKPGKKQPAR